MCGVGISHERNSVARVNIADVRTDRLNNPDSLTPQNRRELRLSCADTAVECLPHKLSAALLDVEKVNAGGLYAYQGLPRNGDRRRKFFPLHDLGTTVGVNTNRVHQVCLPVFLLPFFRMKLELNGPNEAGMRRRLHPHPHPRASTFAYSQGVALRLGIACRRIQLHRLVPLATR